MKNILFLLVFISVFYTSKGQTEFKINDYPLTGGYSILSMDSAKKVFDEIKNSRILEYNYTRGGCDYRAHAVYLLLLKKGLRTLKIWNFAACKIFLSGNVRLLRVKDKLHLSTSLPYYQICGYKVADSVYWGYHVAPMLIVSTKNGLDTMVVDPALFDNLVSYKDWISYPTQNQGSSYYSFIDGNYISFQTESQYINGNGVCCHNCSGNDIITGIFYDDKYSISQKWIEQSLSKGRVFYEYYMKEIYPLEQQLQKYPFNSTDSRAIELACRLAQMKDNISNENGLNKLPDNYKKNYDKYVIETTKVLFQ